jgi:hypothetical protein
MKFEKTPIFSLVSSSDDSGEIFFWWGRGRAGEGRYEGGSFHGGCFIWGRDISVKGASDFPELFKKRSEI